MLFERRLSTRYSAELTSLQNESVEQLRLESRLRETNTGFTNIRKLDSSTQEREAALQALENGYFKYREIVQNLETGRKFYNDLGKLLARLRETVKGWCLERMSEAKTLESDLVTSVEAIRTYDKKKDMGIRAGAVRRSSADVSVALRTPQLAPQLSPSTPTRQSRNRPSLQNQQLQTQSSQKPMTPSSPRQSWPVHTTAPPSPPLPTPTFTRVVLSPQTPSPRPGLWAGDGMTPIRFAGEFSETNRRGAAKR